MDIKKEYERWLENATADANVAAELKTLDNAKIEDAFYRDLAFGTGGLRGVIGAGTNRMNIYTVAKASQGLADYLKKNFAEPSVAIGYDSRIEHYKNQINFANSSCVRWLCQQSPEASHVRCISALSAFLRLKKEISWTFDAAEPYINSYVQFCKEHNQQTFRVMEASDVPRMQRVPCKQALEEIFLDRFVELQNGFLRYRDT